MYFVNLKPLIYEECSGGEQQLTENICIVNANNWSCELCMYKIYIVWLLTIHDHWPRLNKAD